jgi:hypothetical protein
MNSQGIEAGIEMPAEKSPRGQITHGFILHRVVLNKSHGKSSKKCNLFYKNWSIWKAVLTHAGYFGTLE